MPLRSATPPTIEIPSTALSTIVWIAGEDLAAVDRRDVREARDQIVLQARALGGIRRAFGEPDERVRRIAPARRAENEHEPAAARDCAHSTWRTLVTFAAIARPSTSNRISSPTLMLKRSWMLCSIETSTWRPTRPRPARPSRTRPGSLARSLRDGRDR